MIGRDGSVRLTHYALTEVEGEKEYAAARLADVRAAGAILCRLMGIPVEKRGGSRAAESPIGGAARAIASMRRQQRPGYEATHACVVLWEAAGRLGSARSQAQAAAQLGAVVARVSDQSGTSAQGPPSEPAAGPGNAARGGAAPSSGPAAEAPKQPASVSAGIPSKPQRGRSRPADWILGLGVLAVAAGLVAVLAPAAHWSPPAARPAAVSTVAPAPAGVPSPEPSTAGDSQPQASPAPTPAPTATHSEVPLPALAAPLAAGDVNWVGLSARGPCTPGQWCQLEVRAGLMAAGQPRDVSWEVIAPDRAVPVRTWSPPAASKPTRSGHSWSTARWSPSPIRPGRCWKLLS
jgi:hypothetical protein